MTPLRILSPSLFLFAFVSCAPQQKAPRYETSSPYGDPASGHAIAEENSVYDTPAAYEETGATAAEAPSTPAYDAAPLAPAPRPSSNGAAILHTVVAGDTLSGISSKYKVPTAAIRQANRMTNDVVVLGRKMVIPPVN
jgi:LysM repeat protein